RLTTWHSRKGKARRSYRDQRGPARRNHRRPLPRYQRPTDIHGQQTKGLVRKILKSPEGRPLTWTVAARCGVMPCAEKKRPPPPQLFAGFRVSKSGKPCANSASSLFHSFFQP